VSDSRWDVVSLLIRAGHRLSQQYRGGSGIVTLMREGEASLAVRDIVLEPHPP
jgi:hypothetical protein